MLEVAGATVPQDAHSDLETAIAWGRSASVLRLLPLANLDNARTLQLLLLSIERWGRPEIVRALIECGADPNALGGDPEQPFSVLSLAVSTRREHAVRFLLDMGADPEKQAESAALMKVAAEHGDIGIIEALLDHGVPVDVPDHEAWTPLMEACHCSQIEAVRFLIRRGANVNSATLNNPPEYLGGATPLLSAAKIKDGDPTILAELLDAGADLEAADCCGNTALKWTETCGAANALKLLLERGANVNPPTTGGFSVLDQAAMHGHEEVAALLRAAGADEGESARRGGYLIRMKMPGEDEAELGQAD
jgi:ankyrin repeat protein